MLTSLLFSDRITGKKGVAGTSRWDAFVLPSVRSPGLHGREGIRFANKWRDFYRMFFAVGVSFFCIFGDSGEEES